MSVKELRKASFEVRRLNSNPKRRWTAGTGPLAATLLALVTDLAKSSLAFGVTHFCTLGGLG